VVAAVAATVAIATVALVWPRWKPHSSNHQASNHEDSRDQAAHDQASHRRDSPDRRPRADDRFKGPGIHRARPAELAALDRAARVESAKITARKRALAGQQSVPATTWVNVGPTEAAQEVNFFTIAGVDSGRPNTIAVDPRDGNIVYVAVSGGGVWKSFDFLSPTGPTWAPTMDTLPNLAVGALALDPDHPDTMYVGNGDFVDTPGDTVLKSSDGGGTWKDPVVLAGTHPNGLAVHATSIRNIGVHGNRVLMATDVGLFASTDAGASYRLVDLPNGTAGLLLESIWSIARTGGNAWVIAGVTACGPSEGPPSVFVGFDPDPTTCPAGNNVALWRSTDGVTWTQATTPPTVGAGNTQIAVGPTTDPTTTVVWAIVGGIRGDKTLGFWRSTDGGATYVDATGTLANPTLLAQNGDNSCVDINVAHAQSWYNVAIVVDPTNPDHVLVGGNLCGMRTLNGSAASPTWELVSHWLPGPRFGETANGRLAYVHADWHTATSVVVNGQVMTFAGTDGGIFSSRNVFDTATKAESVVWTHHNKGLVTHLMYSVASGDPASGNAFVAFSGLQDNGTRFRADPAHPSVFNQPIGGDGIGATVHNSTAGTTYWASIQFLRVFCKPAAADCSTEQPEAVDDASSHWHLVPSPLDDSMEEDEVAERMRQRARISGEDQEPFFIHYADVETDTAGESVLAHTDEQVLVSTPQPDGSFVFTPISQDLTDDPNSAGFSNVTASRATPGLYGASGLVSAKPFFVTTQGNTMTTWRIAQPIRPTGTAARLTGASSIDFPPTLPAGKSPGDVFIGSFTNIMNDGTVPPDDKGRLWRTTDGGATWQSIVGADPAHRLPNVPIYVAKYDPVTPTTIYAGTQLGMYFTIDDGATWNRMGDNFPVVPVRDMYIAKNQDFIRVATYGRGMWEIYPSSAANHGAPGNGDYDRNLVIDWRDLGAMSARLGETPTATVPPLYSWILDVTGADSGPPVQAIEDNDLQALLAKFGGHP
jgi:hypothetical protein